MYCITQDEITLNLLGFDGDEGEILNLNGKRAAKIKTKNLHEILTANFKTYKDKSGGNVVFVKECSLLDEIQMLFLREISEIYDGISVEEIIIEPQTRLPENFTSFKVQNIFLSGSEGVRGIFRASFLQPDLTSKNLFFKYSFKAKMPVFIAINPIKRGQILGLLDYQASQIDFEKYQKDYIVNFPTSKMIAKSNIKPGEILANRYFNALALVKKGDNLNAVLNEGGLSVIVEVKAMQDGNLGDTIKVKTRENKTMQATVSSPKEVVLR